MSLTTLAALTATGSRARLLAEATSSAVGRVIAVVVEGAPWWGQPVGEGRSARLIGGSPKVQAAVLEALPAMLDGSMPVPAGVLVHAYRPMASRYLIELVGGEGTANAAEVAAWSARGDRKTSASLDGFAILADLHRAAGGALPFRVIAPTGTLVEHRLKLCRTLQAAHWAGCWTLADDEHSATLTVDGTALLQLDLFGTNDPGALDRLRMEAHAAWVDEGAPAALEGASGVSEDAWSMVITSTRLKTARKVAAWSSNYPDDDFWAWRRFETEKIANSVSIRIPPGESASEEDRERWRTALAGRPDLLARLVDGEPAVVQQGPQVAVGYRADVHVAKQRLPVERSLEFWCAWDSAPNAHTHALVIAQRNGRRRLVLASLVAERTGLKQFLEDRVVPWFQRRAPWVLGPGGGEWLYHRYDPSMDTQEGGDISINPVQRIRRALGGSFAPGPIDWESRSGPMLALIGDTDGAGGPALVICPSPDTEPLRKALSGRWYYATTRNGTVVRDLPAKPNHPHEDVGDAFCYLAAALAPELTRRRNHGERPKTRMALADSTMKWLGLPR